MTPEQQLEEARQDLACSVLMINRIAGTAAVLEDLRALIALIETMTETVN